MECRELPPKNEKAVFEFVCTDNGIGMSQEFQEHAFEPFVQKTVQHALPIPEPDLDLQS